MSQRVRNEASGVSTPSTQQRPPPNSARAAKYLHATGKVNQAAVLYTLSSTLNGFRLPSQANVRSNNSSIVSHRWLRVIRSCKFHHTRSIGLQSGLDFGSRCNSIRSRCSHRSTATSSLGWHFALSPMTDLAVATQTAPPFVQVRQEQRCVAPLLRRLRGEEHLAG